MPPARRERYVSVTGWRIRFLEQGAGLPVVLVHGLGGSADSWLNTLRALADRFHLYALDLVGFGYSDKPDLAYRVQDFVHCLRGFGEALGIRQFALVGFSMGGQIAATFTAQSPERVTKLVLIGSAGISVEFTPALKEYARFAEGLQGTRKRLEALVASRRAVSDEYVAQVQALADLPRAREVFQKALRESGRAPRLPRVLRRIRCPTLIVWGREDPIIPVRYAYEFQRHVRQSRVAIIEDCGHLPYLERPLEFLAALRAFLLN